MATALAPLQTALYQKLTGSTDLMSLVTGIFDEVPDGQAFPYVTIGSITETASDAHDHQGLDCTVQIDVWTKGVGTGFKAAYTIYATVDAALDRQPLSVAGFSDVSIACDQHQTLRDPDPDIRHINSQFRVWLTRQS